MEHSYYMQSALEEAQKALFHNEIPIGCVIILNQRIIARAFNKRTLLRNTIMHAEMIAIDQACAALGDWRLEGCALYVTIEPCPMCAGAIVQARIPIVVYGAPNPKAGCGGSILNILEEPRFNHRCSVTRGVLEKECAELMTKFFAKFRNKENTSIS